MFAAREAADCIAFMNLASVSYCCGFGKGITVVDPQMRTALTRYFVLQQARKVARANSLAAV